MITRCFLVMALVACLFHCENRCSAQSQKGPLVQDNTLGIAFTTVGAVQKSDSATYRMTLPASSSSRPAVARVSVSDRLFVDLPASYGGRLYLDTPSASSNIALVDSVNTGGQMFARQYWIVYAGMGMWEGVINCYRQEGGQYYVVSLAQDMPLGKPGEEVDGKPLDGEALKGKFLTSLRDTSSTIVNEFDALLGSMQIHNQ